VSRGPRRSGARRQLGVRSFGRIATRSANALVVVAALAAAGVVLPGCGGGSSSSSSSSTTATTKTSGSESIPAPKPPPNAEEGTVFVSLGSAAGLGQVLVDSEGHTLYAFSKDTAGASACTGACATAWPPLLVEGGEPEPSNGAAASRLATITLPDGSRQVTYAGHPLYSFTADKQPGQANGNGSSAFGGTWTALKGSGEPAG
jgi:predicted lipoprotein with Yx(FWY)xxD motif